MTAYYYNLEEPQFRVPGGAGYSVYAYQIGGTTTPISTYSAYTGGANAWPVVLADDGNGDGVASIFLTQNATIDIKNTSNVSLSGYPRNWIRPASPLEIDAVNTALDARLDAAESDILQLQTDVSGIVVPATLVCSVSMQDMYRQTITVSGSSTKITHFNVEEGSSYSLWNSVDDIFQPTTAGWWNVTVSLGYTFNFPDNDGMRVSVRIHKNGSSLKTLFTKSFSAADGTGFSTANSALVYFNGLTDYLEIHTRDIGGTGVYYVGATSSGANLLNTYFQAVYIGPGA